MGSAGRGWLRSCCLTAGDGVTVVMLTGPPAFGPVPMIAPATVTMTATAAQGCEYQGAPLAHLPCRISSSGSTSRSWRKPPLGG